jgi:PhnB protein
MILPIFKVKDVDASVAFYTGKLGFSLDFCMPGQKEGASSFAMIRLGESVVGLDLSPSDEKRGLGVDIMIYVADDVDIDVFHAELKAKGISFVLDIADQYWGDRAFSINDPDGYKLTFCKTITEMNPDDVIAAQKIAQDSN